MYCTARSHCIHLQLVVTWGLELDLTFGEEPDVGKGELLDCAQRPAATELVRSS